MTSLSKQLLLAASLSLAACSLYQSTGRKSLENNAFSIASGTASLRGCANESSSQAEKFLAEDANAFVFQNEHEATLLRVVLKNSDFNCLYQFINEPAADSHISEIIQDTLVRSPAL